MRLEAPAFLMDGGFSVKALLTCHTTFVACRFGRYVMEDRWTAIRWAIGTAQKHDCVVIAGKGHTDYQEWDLGEGLERVRQQDCHRLLVAAPHCLSLMPHAKLCREPEC